MCMMTYESQEIDDLIEIAVDRFTSEEVKDQVDKFQIKKDQTNILLGIGGSGPTKRIPANIFLDVIGKLSKIKKCKFFLATGKNREEQILLNEDDSY